MEFNAFPLEVKQHIFNLLPASKMLELATVCKDWDAAITPLIPLRNVVIRLPYGAMFLPLLTKSSRKYRAVELWIMDTATRDDMEELYELVDFCKNKFDLKRMFLIVNGPESLVQLYEKYLDVFSSLAELHIKFESCDCTERQEQTIELCLPNVSELRWQESKPCMDYPFPSKIDYIFHVFAPKLTKASVQFCTKVSYWDYYHDQELPSSRKNSSLGSIVLRDCPKLTSLDVTLGNKCLNKLLPDGLESIRKLNISDAFKARLPWDETFSQLTQINTLNLHHCHPDVLGAALNHCKTLTACQIITSDSTGLHEKIRQSWPKLANCCIVTSKCRFTDNIVYRPYLALDHDLGRLVVASDDVVSDESFDLDDLEDDYPNYL